MYLENVQRALFNFPWAITPNGMDLVAAVVQAHLEGKLSAEEIEARTSGVTYGSQYKNTQKQVAVVNLHGPVLSRATGMSALSGATDLRSFSSTMRALADDSDVGRIVLSIDSPGGQVQGLTEAGDAVRYARSKKEVLAVADGTMGSAAYWIGSQATRIIANADAVVGSIGVVAVIRDTSGVAEKAGVKVNVLRSAEFKALLQDGEPISDKALAEQSKLVDLFAEKFISAVSAGRNITLEQARSLATGKVWIGADAIAAGVADEVGTLQEAIDGKFSSQPFNSGSPAAALAGGNTMPLEALLAGLGLAADSSPAQVQAALDTLKQNAAATERMRIMAALGASEGKEVDLTQLKKLAADGEQYRADLLTRLHALTITLEGNTETGIAAADRAKRIFAGADIADISAEVQRLEAKRDAVFPDGQKSRQKDEQPDTKPTFRPVFR
ncbi:S49 family peptidase [Deinococcus cellulosilyticus]|uniref:Peptidase S49 domain-containing protein n=1 Tax=Deinococcus cellulosilyticus (strain DSM 18568 / NBRC 106333 / KACC 11606 / 5516J-15) TaxID=1223518 RepID=A0A511MZ83_DEIC1|nr:S49 family peptidase [Deinococcus cellulosilyticus]GEM45904.1 hypothetical protein DC3_15390 [Deinococcus cellulosilyticus NBRC 106333 = KACC 11606]